MQTLLKKFKKSDSGSFLPLFGLVLFPVLTMVMGVTIDYSRMNNLQSRMQSASDIALIAATKAVQGNKRDRSAKSLDDILTKEFKPFFQANMKLAGHSDFNYAPTFNISDNQSSVTVKAEYEPLFMHFFGYDKIDVAVDLTVNLKVEEQYYVIDIVMCVDATSSMQSTLNAAVANANSFNNDLRKELGMVDDPRMKIRVRPMFFRDWEDAYYMKGPSPLDGGTTKIRHNSSYWDVFKYTDDFIDLDPNIVSNKTKNTNQLKNFLNSENAIGGYNSPEAGATCINQGVRSNWYDATSTQSREYFNVSSTVSINDTKEPNNINITVIPIIVFWTDTSISNPALTRKYIDSTQPGNWNEMKNKVWNNSGLINQKNKILILFGPDPSPSKSGYDRAYDYYKNNIPDATEAEIKNYAKNYKNNAFYTSVLGWEEVHGWDGYAFGGSLQSGNKDGAKIIGKKIKEKLPDLLRLAS